MSRYRFDWADHIAYVALATMAAFLLTWYAYMPSRTTEYSTPSTIHTTIEGR